MFITSLLCFFPFTYFELLRVSRLTAVPMVFPIFHVNLLHFHVLVRLLLTHATLILLVLCTGTFRDRVASETQTQSRRVDG